MTDDRSIPPPGNGEARGVFAWFIACLTVSGVLTGTIAVTGAVASPGLLLPSFYMALMVTMVLTIIPALVLVHLVHELRWPRGMADICLPSMLSFLITFAVSTNTGWAIFIAGLGAIGGLAYWLAAGLPDTPDQARGDAA
ncbi:hypothetical protein [Maricaulis sp.]|uniref:hypothetical protein n=1 Tax=Maricaulis sp. TaxID=1486257 RepID=UPI0025BFC722|nr:hypothetical protein [Maricaulis sp.]